MTEINSPQNSHFRQWKTLLEARGIKKEGLFLLSGRKIVPEVLKSHADSVVASLSFAKTDLPTHLLHRPLFDQLDVLGTRSPILVVKAPVLPQWNMAAAPKEFELLIGLSDPGNLGAIFRSCVAFGVKNVVLLKECASPFLPKSIKTSSGAIFHLNLMKGPSIKDLSLESAICLDMKGEDLAHFQWPKAGRLLLGEEGQGVPDSLANLNPVKIPMTDSTESLNAVVAASIALYDRKIKSAPQKL